MVTADLDSDDTAAVVRNLGDGWDDEECPEKESYVWQLRSRRAPGAGNTVLVAMFDEASTFIVTHRSRHLLRERADTLKEAVATSECDDEECSLVKHGPQVTGATHDLTLTVLMLRRRLDRGLAAQTGAVHQGEGSHQKSKVADKS